MGVMMAPVAGSGSCPACRQTVLKRARDDSFTGLYDITPDPDSPKPRRDSRVLIIGMRRYFLDSLPGRVIIAGAAIRVLVTLVTMSVGSVPRFLAVIDLIAGLAIAVGLGYFVIRLIIVAKRRLLWRVRRKLILSYVFVGFVPALLIVGFFLLCGFLLFYNFSSYLVQSRLRVIAERARFVGHTTALEIQRGSARDAVAILTRRQAKAAQDYPGI